MAEIFILKTCLFQAERLAEYGRILGGSQTTLDGRRTDLQRIEDLFPHDNLGLYDPEPTSIHHVVSVTFFFIYTDKISFFALLEEYRRENFFLTQIHFLSALCDAYTFR